MFKKQAITALLALFMPFMAMAGLAAADLPGNAQWYMYADLNMIKKADSGAVLYKWLEDEVFREVNEETGIDLGKSINSVTAFANEEDGAIMVVDGKLSQENQDKILALATVEGGMDMFTYKGKSYYHVSGDKKRAKEKASKKDDAAKDDQAEGNDHGFDFDDEDLYFSFAVDDRILLTSSASTMEQLLADKGRIKKDSKSDGALFVMTADRSFIQAGMQPDKFKESTEFDSNVIRNAKQVALLVSDEKGQMAIEAKLVTTEPAMAESLGNIVRGLISLQAFNDEVPPELSSIIAATKVSVKDATLSIKTLLDPAKVVEMLNAAD